MMGHVNESRLHDYMERLLPDAEMRAVEAHLDGCDACQAALAELAEVVEAVGDLPVAAVPTRDLWAGIDARISEGVQQPTLHEEGTTVGQDIASLEAHRIRSRRVTLTVGQLLAAGVVLAALSAGTMWTILDAPTGAAPVPGVTEDGLQATFTAGAMEDYDLAVEELEAILVQGRRVLNPRTVLVLEESLREIDEAIDEASEALANDPGSTGLARALTDNMRRKLGLLRHAAGIIQAST